MAGFLDSRLLAATCQVFTVREGRGGRNENVATWTDLLVFVMVVLGVIGTVITALHA